MTTRQTHLRALARAFASALPGASESAPEEVTHPAPRAVLPSAARQGPEDERSESSGEPPGASGQRRKRGGVSSHAAQSLALSRWRRGHMHFSPAVRPLLQADRPEWSVASDAEVPRTK